MTYSSNGEANPPNDVNQTGTPTSGYLEDLRRAVATDVIPRLLVAERDQRRPQHHFGRPGPSARVLTQTCDQVYAAICEGDATEARLHLERVSASGCDIAVIFSDVLGPVARQFGEAWE
ncbi:MAG: hypothetical protein AAGF15_04515, partial [Pseudomonadota bacterium]